MKERHSRSYTVLSYNPRCFLTVAYRPEGFDNFSLVTGETFSQGARAVLRCSFEGPGCPEILLVPQLEEENGVCRYGACIEVVLYKDGINVWRHYREEGKCSWHKRLGLHTPVEAGKVHCLQVEVKEKQLVITLDGNKTVLYVHDLWERFHLGLTLCEGYGRVYDFSAEYPLEEQQK